MPCLVGCMNNYNCGTPTQPVEGDNIAPYVKLFFGSRDNPEISVGNNPSPRWDNTAVIKSFEMGSSNGVGFKAEVLDSQGGAFHLFIEKLNKCMGKSSTEYKMSAEWGWVVTNCNGSMNVIPSPCVTTLPIHCETIFADGKVKFIITGTDLMQNVFAARHDKIEGSDGAKLPLKVAIRNLSQDTEPKFNVVFLRIEKNGTYAEYGFKEGGFQGPKSVWTCNGQNKLATIQNWMENFVTDRDKGVIPIWDSRGCQSEPTLALVEDPSGDCNETVDPCAGSLGTYIVNGGKCSSVISFTPQINWVMGMAGTSVGGNSGGPASGAGVKKKKDCEVQTPETGTTQTVAITKNGWDVYGAKYGQPKQEFAQNKQQKANSLMSSVLQPISAELRIQGDPSARFVHPTSYVGKYISIIVINPFHLFGDGNGGCGDWLADPGCNEILSNKKWFITGCSHSIKEGSYVTTIQVKLVAPGINISGGDPFGGAGSSGYVPNNAC